MIKNVFKKLIFGAALAGVVAATAFSAACTIETVHPSARITVEFNSQTYELDYTLYRNMYPNSVRHFIELADGGFYDDMVVHDYTTTDWYSGAYAYNGEAYGSSSNTESFSQYLEDTSKESAYYDLFSAGKLTPSVYSRLGYDEKKDEEVTSSEYALPTLMGEFYSNISQEITSGALSADYGTLKYYYYAKSGKNKVYVTPTSDQIINADYKYNCATSVLALQISQSSGIGSEKYSTFGKMPDVSELDRLVEDVSDYLTTNFGTSTTDQTYSVSATVDSRESFSSETADKDIETTFHMPKSAIVIRSVKITKY